MNLTVDEARPPKTALVVVDVQGRLAEAVAGSEQLMAEIRRLILGWRALGLPVLLTEQVPEKLGATRAELAEALSGITAIPKSTFSCVGEPAFMRALGAAGVRRVLLCGIETHVCIWQTARDLRHAGYEVEVCVDAVSSRSPLHRDTALARMRDEGARWTVVEMALLERVGSASSPVFRSVHALIK
ncbi:MAG: isochorismatase family protein [Kiritimatiellae bacterium]|nr:isochorismatase family protein [Kiritimatiellia bacterium]